MSEQRGDIVRRATIAAGDVRLSVVVPNYDTAELVGAAIRSILRQTMSALEVIVVDDGWRNNSVARILAIDDPRLAIRRQANRGLAGAHAIQESSWRARR